MIEVKYAHNANLEEECEKALRQIDENEYTRELLDNGIENILKYGIACYRNKCRVMCG